MKFCKNYKMGTLWMQRWKNFSSMNKFGCEVKIRSIQEGDVSMYVSMWVGSWVSWFKP